jgi:hypothetical protein
VTGVEWTGIALHVGLIAGVAVINYRVGDVLKRVERLEDLLLHGGDRNTQRNITRKGVSRV